MYLRYQEQIDCLFLRESSEWFAGGGESNSFVLLQGPTSHGQAVAPGKARVVGGRNGEESRDPSESAEADGLPDFIQRKCLSFVLPL